MIIRQQLFSISPPSNDTPRVSGTRIMPRIAKQRRMLDIKIVTPLPPAFMRRLSNDLEGAVETGVATSATIFQKQKN